MNFPNILYFTMKTVKTEGVMTILKGGYQFKHYWRIDIDYTLWESCGSDSIEIKKKSLT